MNGSLQSERGYSKRIDKRDTDDSRPHDRERTRDERDKNMERWSSREDRRRNSRHRDHYTVYRDKENFQNPRYERDRERDGNRDRYSKDIRDRITNRSPQKYSHRRDDDLRREEGFRREEPYNPPLKTDEKLPVVDDDPRVDKATGRKRVKTAGGGRNTESFDPRDTLVRPELRILVGPNKEVYDKPLKHDDVIVVPEFFCKEDDWDIYYKLIAEIRELHERGVAGTEFISWHEGAHLIVKDPTPSPTFQMIQDKIGKYLSISNASIGTRFNWYRDSTDFKPFHHDSAAFNPQRARNQNITVGVTFGSTRELAFLHASNKTKVYFPQTNGMLFSFGRDVNIRWKHGINALPPEAHNGLGRISIVLWGWAGNTIEEEDSPPMLNDNARGHGNHIHAYK